MTIDNLPWIISAFAGVTALVAALAMVRLSRKQLADLRQEQETLRTELRTANAGNIGMGQRLLAVEQRLKSALEKQEQQGKQDVDSFPYSQASELLGNGSSTDEVVRRCGLSQAEVSLMQLMQGRRSPRAVA